MTPNGDRLPPCRRCGSTDFTIVPDPRLKRGLTRACVPCRRRRDLAYRWRHIERRRVADARRKKTARVRKILAERAA